MSGTVRREGFDYMDLDDFEELLADKPEHEKWELIGGRVVRMMVGARWEHNRIVQNISGHLLASFRTKGSNCRPFAETFFMKRRDFESALLPDVMVRCGPLDRGATSLDDPVVVFEVLSEGSAARDRLEKWAVYQRLASLVHYVLVERDRPAVELRSRVGSSWSGLRILDGLDAVIDLPAIDMRLPLSVIYEDVLQGKL
jgi:Uma2 family endonuclease